MNSLATSIFPRFAFLDESGTMYPASCLQETVPSVKRCFNPFPLKAFQALSQGAF